MTIINSCLRLLGIQSRKFGIKERMNRYEMNCSLINLILDFHVLNYEF